MPGMVIFQALSLALSGFVVPIKAAPVPDPPAAEAGSGGQDTEDAPAPEGSAAAPSDKSATPSVDRSDEPQAEGGPDVVPSEPSSADDGDDADVDEFGDDADDEPWPDDDADVDEFGDDADDEPWPDDDAMSLDDDSDDDDDDGELFVGVDGYDPVRDSPEGLRATRWIRLGIGTMSVGSALLVGAVVMGASNPCNLKAGNSCQQAARDRAALVMGIPAGALLLGGATALGVGLERRQRLSVDLQASREHFGVVVRGRF